MKAQAQFHFSVNRLHVDAELLGSTRSIRRGDYDIQLILPATDLDFGITAADFERTLGAGIQKGDRWVARSVLILRVNVDLELPDSAKVEHVDSATITEVTRLLKPAADAARSVVYQYINLVRTRHGQCWLTHSAESPKITWLTNLVDRETGERIRIGYSDPIKVTMMTDDWVLTASEHAELLSAVERNEIADLPAMLLSDAHYLAGPSEPPQYREALLLAAIAAEVKIKEALDMACPLESRDLLAFALHNPRDVSVQAAALYDKCAWAVTGRSLLVDDREAYKALQQLFQDRNAIAHRAHSIGSEEARRGLKAAAKAIAWASSLYQVRADKDA